MARPFILFLRGCPDDETVKVQLRDVGKYDILWPGLDNTPSYLSGAFEQAEFIVPKKSLQDLRLTRGPDVIFNLITEADLYPQALESAAQFCDTVHAQHHSAVINHPQAILKTKRDTVAQGLQGMPGLIVPRTERWQLHSPSHFLALVQEQAFPLPCLVRAPATHGGDTLVRIDSEADIDKLHVFPFDGREFYITEYVDYASDEGLHRKARIVVVDGQPLLRHFITAEDWIVNAHSAEYMKTRPNLTEEQDRMLQEFNEGAPPEEITQTVKAIHENIGLDYFGIDCSIMPDGRLLIFEVNATMNILLGGHEHPAVHLIIEAIERMILRMAAPTLSRRIVSDYSRSLSGTPAW